MNVAAVMMMLEASGKARTADLYRRHGVRERVFGVPYAELGAVLRALRLDHRLALALWETGVHEAQLLATKLADPRAMEDEEIEAWVGEVSNYVTGDAVSGLAARLPRAARLARGWLRSGREFPAAVGWNVMALRALNDDLPEREGRALLRRIRTGMARARNRERHSMNNALIAIGGKLPRLRREALAVARAVSPVEVDHGETGCRTPDAGAAIARMADRGRGRTRVTGARLRARRR